MPDPAEIEFSAIDVFARGAPGRPLPRVFGAPQRYVQGQGVIDVAGHYLARLGIARAAVLCSTRSASGEGGRLMASLSEYGIDCQHLTFNGECSLSEIDRHVDGLRAAQDAPDAIVAVGGGKAVDAGRAIASRLGTRTVVVPSLASNDAPCAAVSVIYTDEGVTLDAELYDESPVLVLVDTGVVAQAGERYLVAGMGDAMATWYEARVATANPEGVNAFGGRPTLAGSAIARLCAETLYEHGLDAIQAVRRGQVTPALEQVVEANTLLSGLGYESGGLAASHAFAQGFTVVESVHRSYLHGEMVAMGTLAQLVLEDAQDELARASHFFLEIGLPVHLGHLGLSASDSEAIDAVVRGAMAFPFVGNMTVPVSEQGLREALLAADAHGAALASA
jgi:glycerol dehydrogenase